MSDRIEISERVTIYTRGKKKIYTADFFHEGNYCRKSLGTSYKKIATERALKLSVRLNKGNYETAPVSVTLAEAIDAYMVYLITEGRGRKTLVKYRGVFKIFSEYLAENQIARLPQVTIAWFDKFRAVRQKVRQPKTLYTEGVIIKQFFRWPSPAR